MHLCSLQDYLYFVCVCVYRCSNLCVHTFVYVCIFMYVCICVCVCVSIHVWVYLCLPGALSMYVYRNGLMSDCIYLYSKCYMCVLYELRILKIHMIDNFGLTIFG